jgi:predicted PurR-regulated permease PerM
VGISLILTFMFLWDWPNIARGVTSLKDSRLAGIYSEVAPSLEVFAQLFGKALQAQTRIALVNTLLTFTGMWLLGIPGLLLLSLFVFMCRCSPHREPWHHALLAFTFPGIWSNNI